jgi:hypothetical protein
MQNLRMPSGWSREEVEATVADYFAMLLLELTGQPFNKAAHNRALQLKLDARSQAAVEFKRRNISAILIELGCVYIAGYKPSHNYQRLLRDVIEERLLQDHDLHTAASRAVEQESTPAKIPSFHNVLVEPPKLDRVKEPAAKPYVRRAIQFDYLEREARNRSLGLSGELFIAEFETQRLHAGGHSVLANRVEHVSQSRGDGLGYDVLSFEPSGKERLIEVKTTAFGSLTPFFVSSNELRFSEERNTEFVLARVHEFRTAPKFFELRGSMKKNLRLDPVSFRARL